jgi:hypothetical protein
MTFRRELDQQRGTENLRHLLEEIEQRSQIINRKRYIVLWNPKAAPDRMMANRMFDKIPIVKVSDNPDADHLDPRRVATDRAKLEADTEHVREYVERTYAHRTPASATPVTFGDFHAAIDAIVPIFKRYYAWLTLNTITQVEPVPQYDTHECFTFPWWDASQGPSKV